MDIIHLLPDSVANQIAAGEVIQRPASCLKELVENSLDAGATNVQILLYDSGRTLLQVIDDGKGMSETDARMAFERHATSKIRSAQDLFSLHTMGFRGEALASICAVAQIEMTSRRAEDEMGTRIEINGSEVIVQEPCACPIGTNIKVKNLFYNVPARRRFLKTDATELRNILNEFYRIVLVNPQCQFTICNNDEVLLDLPSGTAKQRIEQVFGKGTNKQFTSSLVELKSDTELISIRGYVGKPEYAVKNAQQYFFVNNRYMRHPYFHKAVMTAYQGMLSADHNPSYFIYFDVNPESIDVNIHPTKTEIKFADEQSVWQILLATVREALGKFNIVPPIDFENASNIEIPAPAKNISDIIRPEIKFDPTYNPFNQPNSFSPQWSDNPSSSNHLDIRPQSRPSEFHTKRSTAGWEQLYNQQSEEINKTISTSNYLGSHEDLDSSLSLFDDDLAALTPYQYGRYILLPAHNGLLIIEQHRAHVCVLYEQIKQSLQERRGVSQQLLFPELIDLTPDETSLLLQAAEELRYVGFDLYQFSPNTFSINGLPAILGEENATKAVMNILSLLKEEGINTREKWRDDIIQQLSEEAAIPSGKPMSEAEMRDLVHRLFELDLYGKTPQGKTVMNLIRINEIEKLFV